jgi:hypothetical protein
MLVSLAWAAPGMVLVWATALLPHSSAHNANRQATILCFRLYLNYKYVYSPHVKMQYGRKVKPSM